MRMEMTIAKMGRRIKNSLMNQNACLVLRGYSFSSCRNIEYSMIKLYSSRLLRFVAHFPHHSTLNVRYSIFTFISKSNQQNRTFYFSLLCPFPSSFGIKYSIFPYWFTEVESYEYAFIKGLISIPGLMIALPTSATFSPGFNPFVITQLLPTRGPTCTGRGLILLLSFTTKTW